MANNPNESIRLYNGEHSIAMWVENGHAGLQRDAVNPGSLWAQGGGAGKYGDNEPNFAFNEQRTWEGGRALEDFSDDQMRYYDSKGAWTLTPKRLGPAPQWKFGNGYRPNKTIADMPGNVFWQPLDGGTRYVTRTIIPAEDITVAKVYIWVRRVGTPRSDLTLELCQNSSGLPGTVLKTVTVSTQVISDVVSVLHGFAVSGGQALSNGTTYHLKLYGGADDTRDGHWEIAVNNGLSGTGFSAADDSNWVPASFSLYFRMVGADLKSRPLFFTLKEALYCVFRLADGGASRLFMNGKRGKATAGSSTTLTDTNNAFGSANHYAGALIKIVAGTGFGQVQEILSHTNTVLTTAAWDITPDNTSEYIVYQTPHWTEITGTGLGRVQDVAVYNNIAHFAHMGSGDPIRQIRFNPAASPPAHEFRDDGSNEANILCVGHNGTAQVLWRAVNTAGAATLSVATAQTWGNNHTFGTGFAAGDGSYPVTKMVGAIQDNRHRIYVLKTGELGFIDDGKWYKMNIDLASFTEATNGQAALNHGLFLFLNWAYSVERIYGTNVDDLDPNKEAGFPPDRQGFISDIISHPVGPLMAMDAGDNGYSSVQFWDGNNYHEIFRAFERGKRISSLVWQTNEAGRRYLWIGVGDDLVYLQFPRYHRDPYRDPLQEFMHEFVFISGTYDMGNASIYKAWKDYTLITKNLGNGVKVHLDYQLDGDIGTEYWTQLDVGAFRASPSQSIPLMVGGSKSIRIRLRGNTDHAQVPPIVHGTVLKGTGQVQTKYTTTYWANFGPVARQVGGDDEDVLAIIRENTEKAMIWDVQDCIVKEWIGAKVLLSVVSERPQYTTNKRDNLTAQIHMMEL